VSDLLDTGARVEHVDHVVGVNFGPDGSVGPVPSSQPTAEDTAKGDESSADDKVHAKRGAFHSGGRPRQWLRPDKLAPDAYVAARSGRGADENAQLLEQSGHVDGLPNSPQRPCFAS
jgi:hypothetical protein